jgi:hypothetical protein
MNKGLHMSMGGFIWHMCADVIMQDRDPLEDIGLFADPAARMALVIQAGAVVRQ